MGHANMEKMLNSAQIESDFNKREEYLNKYINKGNSTKKLILIGLVILLIIYILCRRSVSFRDTMFFMAIAIPFFAFIFGILIYLTQKFKIKVKKIIDTNEPLLYFESDIMKLYKIKQFDRNLNRDHFWYYIDLKDGVTIDILEWQYDDFLARDIQKVKIYFFKSLLVDKSISTKVFDVEPIINNF